MKSDARKAETASGAQARRLACWLLAGTSGCATAPAPAPPGALAATVNDRTAAQPVPKACDRSQRCGGQAPLCLISSAGSRCGAVSEADALPHDGSHAALACGARADCASGERCCTNPLWDRTRCAASCDAANEAELCDTDADCGSQAPCRGAAHGPSRGALPGWVKTCDSK